MRLLIEKPNKNTIETFNSLYQLELKKMEDENIQNWIIVKELVKENEENKLSLLVNDKLNGAKMFLEMKIIDVDLGVDDYTEFFYNIKVLFEGETYTFNKKPIQRKVNTEGKQFHFMKNRYEGVSIFKNEHFLNHYYFSSPADYKVITNFFDSLIEKIIIRHFDTSKSK